MATEPGTFERIALVLSEALSPLAARLEPAELPRTFGELGLYLPTGALSPSVRAAIGAAATAAGELPELTGELTAAISVDGNGIQIGAKVGPLAAKIVTLLDSFDTISTQFKALDVDGVSASQLNAFANALPGRLLELLLIEALEARQPTLTAVLSLLGIIEPLTLNAGLDTPALPQVTVQRLRIDRFGALFSDPIELLFDVYKWGGAGLDIDALLSRVYTLLTKLSLPVARSWIGAPPRPVLDIFLARIAGTAAGIVPKGVEATVAMPLADGTDIVLPITDTVDFEISADGQLGANTAVRVQPPAAVTVIPPQGNARGQLKAGIVAKPAAGQQALTLFGVAGGSRLEATRLSVALVAEFTWTAPNGPGKGDVGFEGRIQGGKLVISVDGADGFVGSIVGSAGIETDFDLGFGWTAGGGLYFVGSSALEVKVPVHVDLGPAQVTALTLRIGVDGDEFPISLTADLVAALGPITAVVEDIGATAALSFPDDRSGNLGLAQVDFAFKPPKGVGLALEVGVVRGGGYLFLDPDRGEYAGTLELLFAELLSVQAIGLISTKNPDGSPGFSLLVILTAEFPGGLPLGFGFNLLAVGGLLGINRTMNLQALMEGVRTGAVESVMFPQDVVANAPRILSDLRAFFPTRQDTFLVGPMVKLGWGTPTLMSLSVGVIVEIPGNVAIVGVLKVGLPAEDLPLLLLQVNFAGAIEPDKQRLWFYAALFESRVLHMTIEGEMGLLVAWGDDANFVLSVGGFHPSFSPPPLPFSTPRRVSVNILDVGWGRIRAVGYFAITSNTVQFGARVEVYFGFDAFNVQGHIGFDALFRFSPFYFNIRVSASFELSAFGVGVFSIRIRMSLEGPSPWRARGTGSISLLIFEIEVDIDETWGEGADTAVEAADVLPLVVAGLSQPSAWQANVTTGSHLSVNLRALEASNAPADELVLHPLGTLHVRQQAVPLDLSIAKVGSRKARDATKFSLSTVGPGLTSTGHLDDRFAMAQFLALDDAAKLSRPAFERQHAGLELSAKAGAAGTARTVRRFVRFEIVVIDGRYKPPGRYRQAIPGLLFAHFLNGAAITASPLSVKQARLRDPHGDRFGVRDGSFSVASTVDNTSVTGGLTFTSEAAAFDHLATLVADDPIQAGAVHVIPTREMNGAQRWTRSAPTRSCRGCGGASPPPSRPRPPAQRGPRSRSTCA